MTPDAQTASVHLLGDFEVRNAGMAIDLHRVAQRLLGYLALRPRAVERSTLAATLWPDLGPSAGLSRVRDVLYKLRGAGPELVSAGPRRVGLSAGVMVDVVQAQQLAASILGGAPRATVAPVELFCSDLLPDWQEEWLVADRQAFTMLRLRALERIAENRLAVSHFSEAERACVQIITAEPYRETAHLLLAQVYLHEGNPGQALRTLGDFQRRLRSDLGLGASAQMQRLAMAIRAAGCEPAEAVS